MQFKKFDIYNFDKYKIMIFIDIRRKTRYDEKYSSNKFGIIMMYTT